MLLSFWVISKANYAKEKYFTNCTFGAIATVENALTYFKRPHENGYYSDLSFSKHGIVLNADLLVQHTYAHTHIRTHTHTHTHRA